MLCSPFWKLHLWRPWIAVRRVQMQTQRLLSGIPIGEPYNDGIRIYQERQCARCGVTQARKKDVR
jgi:hypothetical protein